MGKGWTRAHCTSWWRLITEVQIRSDVVQVEDRPLPSPRLLLRFVEEQRRRGGLVCLLCQPADARDPTCQPPLPARLANGNPPNARCLLALTLVNRRPSGPPMAPMPREVRSAGNVGMLGACAAQLPVSDKAPWDTTHCALPYHYACTTSLAGCRGERVAGGGAAPLAAPAPWESPRIDQRHTNSVPCIHYNGCRPPPPLSPFPIPSPLPARRPGSALKKKRPGGKGEEQKNTRRSRSHPRAVLDSPIPHNTVCSPSLVAGRPGPALG